MGKELVKYSSKIALLTGRLYAEQNSGADHSQFSRDQSNIDRCQLQLSRLRNHL